MKDAKSVLSKTGFDAFREYIESRTGIYIDESKKNSFALSLTARMNILGIHNYKDYYSFLTAHATGKNEFDELLSLILIQETFFFRDERQLRVLTTRILPKLREQKHEIKIWSAGCATGEEPYSIAIAIAENFLPGSIHFSLSATDINPATLALAKKGVYSKNSMRSIDKVLLNKYFTLREGRYYLNERIKQLVHFDTINLVEPYLPAGYGNFDIIFCKNVIIYFRLETVKKVIHRFHGMLSPGGYLFVGHSESLWQISDEFALEEISGVFFYRKKGGTPAKHPTKKIFPKEKQTRADTRPYYLQSGSHPRPLQYQKTHIQPTLTGTENKTTDGQEGPRHNEPQPNLINGGYTALKDEKTCQRNVDTASIKTRIKSLQDKGFQFSGNEYEVLLEDIQMILEGNPENIDAHLLLVKIFINMGLYDKALKKSADILKINDLCAEVYELTGSIYYKIGEKEKAIASFKRTIYLDDTSLVSHYYLGNLYKDFRLTEQAIKEYKNVLRAVEINQISDEQLIGDIFTVRQLKEVCTRNIEILTR